MGNATSRAAAARRTARTVRRAARAARAVRAVRAVIEPIERRIFFAVALDPTWGDAGSVTLPPEAGASDQTTIAGIGLQSGGKLLVLTSESVDSGANQSLVRYNGDGSLDASFGDGGTLALPAAEAQPGGMSIMPDDRVLLKLNDFGTEPLFEMRKADGTLDTSFGNNGRVALHHAAGVTELVDTTTTVAPDGHIYVSQSGFDEGTDVWRLNPDGSLDTTFSSDGTLRFTEDTGNFTLRVQPDGGLLLGWSTRLHRISPDGTFHADITGDAHIGPREEIEVQGDGKILELASFYYETTPRIARFNADGTLDTTYGDHGYATTSALPGIHYDPGIEFTLDSEGRAVVLLIEYSASQLVRFDTSGKQESLGAVDSLPLHLGGGGVDLSPAAADGKIFLLSQLRGISRIADVATQDVTLSDGFLTVRGTASADTITVGKSGSNVVLSRNGTTTTYPAADVQEVSIDGLDGNDSITVSNDIVATINGRGGADTITTSNGNDFIRGGDGNDVISTAIGEDTIDAGAGNDSITCGDVATDLGEDAIYHIDGKHSILGGDGDDTISTGAGEDHIEAGEGNNRMTLGLGEDDIYTGNGDNYIESPEIFAYTGTGNDTIVAMGSDYYDDSWIKDTGGDDSITCGNGWDSIDISGGGKDTIATGSGRDAIQYTGGDAAKGIGATIDAGEGDDGIHADVALSVNGGSDEDEMWGDAFGGTGADHIFVATPLGPIFAGIGNDYIRTIAAATIFGGDGNDDIHTGDQRDFIYCGAGRDTVHAGNASDLISGGGGRDVLFGQGGKDRIYAGAGDDLIFGQGGNDRLVGATGADTLNGGDGDDQADKHDEEGDVVIDVEL